MDIFEAIAQTVHCPYVSDLRFLPWRESAKKEIKKVKITKFSLNSLSDFIEYVFEEKRNFKSHDEVREYLKAH